MKPSLFSLFKRGKYYHAPPSSTEGGDPQSDEINKHERKEVERFAGAAVAFCLKYNPAFRKHFWKAVTLFTIVE